MRQPPFVLLRVRLVALFLVSLAAVFSSLAALHPSALAHPLGLLAPPVILAMAALGGALAFDRLSAFAERLGRARVRIAGWFYGSVVILAFLAVLSGLGEALLTAHAIMIGAQGAFLLLAGLGRGYIGTLVNAFVLSCIAGLAGGPAAAAAMASHAGLIVFFLAVDSPARMLAEYPVEETPPAGPFILKGAFLAVAVAAGLAGFFLAVPPEPYVLFRLEALGGEAVGAALGALYRDLAIVMLLAALAFYALLRWSIGRPREGRELRLEHPSARRRSEPAAAPARAPAGEGKGWRGRVVRLYVRTLEQLASWGIRRRPDQTASELASRLEPREPAEALTALFVRARYGPSDLSEEDFREASRASAAILDRARGRK